MIFALAGRRVDAQDLVTSRFPSSNIPLVRTRIRDVLVAQKAAGLVCAAACGADLLGLEVAEELGIERHIILPFSRERFRSSSVIDRGEEWGPLFDRLVDEAEKKGNVLILSKTGGKEENAYIETNIAIIEHAINLSRQRDVSAGSIIVWDGGSRGVDDITAAFYAASRHHGLRVWQILTL